MGALPKSVDGEDLLDLVVHVEKAAGFALPDDAFVCDYEITVGEVFDILWRGLPDHVKRNGKCPTLMVYLMIRSRCAAQGYAVQPDTRLSDLQGFDYSKFRSNLLRAGWIMPSAEINDISFYAACLIGALAGYLTLPIGGLALLVAIVTFLSVLLIVAQFDLTITCQKQWTLAQLTRNMAYCNLKRLRLSGASLHRKFLWRYFEDRCGNGEQVLQRGARVI